MDTEPNTLARDVNDIYRMLSDAYVKSAAEKRLKLIVFEEMRISGNLVSQFIVDRYFVPFAIMMYWHIMAIGVCPFRFMKVRDEDGNSLEVPVALARESFTVSVEAPAKGEIRNKYIITPFTTREGEIHVVHPSLLQGISPSGRVDSIGGTLLGPWRRAKSARDNADALAWRIANPYVFMYKPAITSIEESAAILEERDQLANGKVDASGYRALMPPPITIEGNVATISRGFAISNATPEKPDKEIIAYYTGIIHDFERLVDATLDLHIQTIRLDTGGLHSRSAAAVDEARADTTTGLKHVIAEICLGIQNVILQSHHETSAGITVTIPFRTLATLDDIRSLLADGLISRDQALCEISNITGIQMPVDCSKATEEEDDSSDTEETPRESRKPAKEKKPTATSPPPSPTSPPHAKRRKAPKDDSQ